MSAYGDGSSLRSVWNMGLGIVRTEAGRLKV